MTSNDEKIATEPAKTEDAEQSEMAKSRDAVTTETAKSEDVAKAKNRQDSRSSGEDVPVPDDAAKTKGKTNGRAESDVAAKTKGRTDGKAGDDAVQAKGKTVGDAEDDEEFVSPEDASKTKWEARVRAERLGAEDDDDYAEVDRQEAIRYQRGLEHMTQVNQEKKGSER